MLHFKLTTYILTALSPYVFVCFLPCTLTMSHVRGIINMCWTPLAMPLKCDVCERTTACHVTTKQCYLQIYRTKEHTMGSRMSHVIIIGAHANWFSQLTRVCRRVWIQRDTRWGPLWKTAVWERISSIVSMTRNAIKLPIISWLSSCRYSAHLGCWLGNRRKNRPLVLRSQQCPRIILATIRPWTRLSSYSMDQTMASTELILHGSDILDRL